MLSRIRQNVMQIRALLTPIAGFFASSYGKLAAVSLVVVLSATLGLLVASHEPSTHTKQSVNVSATEIKEANIPKVDATSNAIPEPSPSERIATGPQLQPKGSVSGPEPAHEAPPYITAQTSIENTTQQLSPTCDFTVVVTASALYHSGQSPYASHTVNFALALQASDGSANFSQMFSYTFAPGETKQFRLSGSFNKPLTESTYQVKPSSTMTLGSGSATLGPNPTFGAVGICGPRSPAP